MLPTLAITANIQKAVDPARSENASAVCLTLSIAERDVLQFLTMFGELSLLSIFDA